MYFPFYEHEKQNDKRRSGHLKLEVCSNTYERIRIDKAHIHNRSAVLSMFLFVNALVFGRTHTLPFHFRRK